MSDRLTISARFSVLMMALYVLLGPEAQRTALGPSSLAQGSDAAQAVGAPALLRLPDGWR